MNTDGGGTVRLGPKAPKIHEKSWVQIMPGQGCNVALRLYGPPERPFDRSRIG